MKLFEQVPWWAKLLGLHWFQSSWYSDINVLTSLFSVLSTQWVLSILSPSSCTKCQESCLVNIFNHALYAPYWFSSSFLALAWVTGEIGYWLRWYIGWRHDAIRGKNRSIDSIQIIPNRRTFQFHIPARRSRNFREIKSFRMLILSNFQILTHFACVYGAQCLITDAGWSKHNSTGVMSDCNTRERAWWYLLRCRSQKDNSC